MWKNCHAEIVSRMSGRSPKARASAERKWPFRGRNAGMRACGYVLVQRSVAGQPPPRCRRCPCLSGDWRKKARPISLKEILTKFWNLWGSFCYPTLPLLWMFSVHHSQYSKTRILWHIAYCDQRVESITFCIDPCIDCMGLQSSKVNKNTAETW